MTDYGPLDAAVTAIRPKNPGIARAFDQVETILKTVAPPNVPPPPPPPPPPSTDIPPFSPSRSVSPTTLPALLTALANLSAGDLLTPVGSFAGQIPVSKVLTTGPTGGVKAVLDLRQAKFPGSASAYVGLWCVQAGGIRTIGGEFTNPRGDGIRSENCPGVIEHYDPVVHHVGSQGILVQGNGGPNAWVKIVRPNVYACGDIAYDSHGDGTGLHCIYFGGGLAASGGEIIDAHCHDQEYGCGIEIGANAVNLRVANPLLERMNGGHFGDAGGNAFNLWGAGNHNVLIDGAHGSGISGRAAQVDGSIGTGAPGAVTMQHARFGSTGRSPAYMASPGVVYTDCA